MNPILAQVAAAVPPDAAVDLVDKLDGVYDRMLNTMLIYLTIIFGVAGILIPIVTVLIQKQLFKLSMKDVEASLREAQRIQRDALLSELQAKADQLKAEILDGVEKGKVEIHRELAFVEGGIYYQQGIRALGSKNWLRVIDQMEKAGSCSLRSLRYNMVHTCLEYITTALGNMTSDQFDADGEVFKRLNGFKDTVLSKNDSGQFSNHIQALTAAFSAMKKRNKTEA